MLKSFIKALGLVAGLALSGFASAISMGGINVVTALGQPLQAEIALETSSKAEASNLSARLASPDSFKNAGLDFPYGLPALTFQIEINPVNGKQILKITSQQPVNEPFVNFLVELSWSSGKLLREYTFLLDPPGYVVEQPKVEVVPIEPSVVVAPESESMFVEEKSIAEPASAPVAAEEKAPIEKIPETAAKRSNVASGTIKVKRGDTLHKLASEAKFPHVSLERMLVALYRANADAFDGNNMNRLKTGKILRVPELTELEGLTQTNAVKEIHIQAADWHTYRQKLAAASKLSAEETHKQEVSGKISTTVAGKTPAAKETAKEVVRLSKGEAPGDKTAASGGTKSAQDKIHAQQEEVIASKKALEESGERTAMLEKNIKAMQRLIELKNKSDSARAKPAPGQVEGQAAGKAELGKLELLQTVPAPAATASSAVAAGSAVQPAKPAAIPKVVAVQPSMLDEILGEPRYLAGVVAVLLGMGGLIFMLKKRKKRGVGNKDADSDRLAGEEVGSATGRISAPILPSPETGDFTTTLVTTASAKHAPVDEIDPISEADLFLNFGRDEQAEEILKDALIKDPKNNKIYLKLLSIYVTRKDVNSFTATASKLKDSGDETAWEQAAAMGRKLEPANPMYGGDGGAPVENKPDFNTAFDTMIDIGTPKVQPATLDFDIGFATAKVPTVATKVPVANAAANLESTIVMNAPMDFEITGAKAHLVVPSSENAEAPAFKMDDLIFDITANHAPAQLVASEPELAAAKLKVDEDVAFSLDFGSTGKHEPTPAQGMSKEPMDMGLAEISLEMGEPVTPAVAPAPVPSSPAGDKDAHWEDIATKLDLAKAYQEMGDAEGAREILQEVVRDGNEQQRTAAELLLQELST